jgi:DUF4097 and DUF4098 domain-containing protein YvlB
MMRWTYHWIAIAALAMAAAPTEALAQVIVESAGASAERVIARNEHREQARQRRDSERENQTERISRTVNIGATGEIDLSNISGDITVTAGGGSTATIEAVKTAYARTAEEARAMLPLVQVEITERGTRAEARVRYPENESRRGNRNINVSVAFTVVAPAGTRVMAKSISGSVSVRDISGPLTLETISGSVKLANTGRTASARSISGDIEAIDTKLEGALEASTVSGTVRMQRLNARSVTVNSISGSVDVEDVTAERVGGQSISGDIRFSGDLQQNGRYEFTSHSGTIRLTIGGSSKFDIEATSFSGSINSDIPITVSGSMPGGRRNRSMRGSVGGGGGATLDLTTFSGSIHITKR